MFYYESFDTFSDGVNDTYDIYMVKLNVYSKEMVMDEIILAKEDFKAVRVKTFAGIPKENCGDKVKVSKFLVLIMCVDDGKLDIYTKGSFTNIISQKYDGPIGESVAVIDYSDLGNLTQTFVFVSNGDQIIAYEILGNKQFDNVTLIIKMDNFADHLHEDRENTDDQKLHLAGGKSFLLINWSRFSKFYLYNFCSLNTHINTFQKEKCI